MFLSQQVNADLSPKLSDSTLSVSLRTRLLRALPSSKQLAELEFGVLGRVVYH